MVGVSVSIDILEAIDESIVDDIRDSASHLNGDVGDDNVIDAFALALTASPKPDRSRPFLTNGQKATKENLVFTAPSPGIKPSRKLLEPV
jgi:hypothetical protein